MPADDANSAGVRVPSASLDPGRGVPAAEGMLVAEFTGNRGWFFRNRERQDLPVTLRVRGAHGDFKQMR